MIKRKDGFSGERAIVLPLYVIQDLENDAYASLLHITEIGYYPKAKHHYRVREEPINQYIFIYCVDGSGWFKLGDNTYPVATNQYFILPAGVPHAYGADEQLPWTIYWIHFKGKIAAYHAKGQAQPLEIRSSLHSRISDRFELFEEIYRTLDMGFSKENVFYASSVFHHYLGTLLYIQQYRDASKNQAHKHDIVAAAIHCMKENIGKKLTLEDIARRTGYSSSHFSSIFHKRTGYAPLNYFNQLKMQQACKLLDFTDLRVNQICYNVGIDDTYYFSRLFKKVMGVSPSEYKRLKKG